MKTMMVSKQDGLMYNMKSFHTLMRDRYGYNPETNDFEKWAIYGFRGSGKNRERITFPFDTEEERDAAWEELEKI